MYFINVLFSFCYFCFFTFQAFTVIPLNSSVRMNSNQSKVYGCVIPRKNDSINTCCFKTIRPVRIYWLLCLSLPDPPIVKLSIGRGLNPSAIKEGADVYFTCHVLANPPASRTVFFHEVRSAMREKGIGLREEERKREGTRLEGNNENKNPNNADTYAGHEGDSAEER